MDAHPPFQIDGNFGGTAGVCEMLLQSGDGWIELLPAVPSQWADGQVSGLCARGGYQLSFSWHDGRVTRCTIAALRPATVTLTCNGRQQQVELKAGSTELEF